MWPVTVPQWGRLFCGKWESDSYTVQYRPQPEDMERWSSIFKLSPTAQDILNKVEDAVNFFKIESDLALLIPRNEWVECFYSMKNGFVAPNCPAAFIYFSKLLYKQHRIYNDIGPMLPKALKQQIAKKDYFGAGYTARDAICCFVGEQFQPITEEQLIVRCGSWYEAYIPSTDRVVALPMEIGKVLTNDDLYHITLKPKVGLTLDDKPLMTLGNVQEVPKSFYDLRGTL